MIKYILYILLNSSKIKKEVVELGTILQTQSPKKPLTPKTTPLIFKILENEKIKQY
jgi:hypothetical protein